MRAQVPSRQESVARTAQLLQRMGFFVADLHTVRPSCFDIIARRDSELLLIKILKNIDAIGGVGASSIISIAQMMNGSPILIGATSGGENLEDGVIYNRYGLTIVTYGTLEDYLQNGIPPFLVSSPGGIFVKINGRRLRDARERSHRSLGAVASMVGVSRRAIQLYEEGAGAEVEAIQRLEEIFGIPLATPLNPFESPSPLRQREGTVEEGEWSPEVPQSVEKWMGGIISALGGQGWMVEVTVRSPFDALARHEGFMKRNLVLMGVGDLPDAERRAKGLHDIARVAESWSLFVVPERKHRENIEGTPLVELSELRRRRDPEDLFELIEERTEG